MTDELARYIDAVDDVWVETLALVRTLNEEQGDLPTDCAGWTIKDQLAHMVGLDQVLVGSPHPDVELPDLEHVSSPVDVYMEQQVHVRRPLPMAAIADELAGLRPRRLKQMRALAEHGPDHEVEGPMGMRRALAHDFAVRPFDLWTHEQDIRRALGHSMRMDCDAAAIALERSLAAWPMVLPGKVEFDGVLIIDIDGHDAVAIELGAGGPETILALDARTALQLGCGRGDRAMLLAGASITGDANLVHAAAPHLAFTP